MEPDKSTAIIKAWKEEDPSKLTFTRAEIETRAKYMDAIEKEKRSLDQARDTYKLYNNNQTKADLVRAYRRYRTLVTSLRMFYPKLKDL